MSVFVRTSLRLFALANPAYRNATVTFFNVDANGVRLATKPTLYAGPTGTATLANPQTLDGDGKLAQPVYHEVEMAAVVTQASIDDHATGVIRPGEVSDTISFTFAGDPNGNVAGAFVGQQVWDSTNKVQWVCTTPGTAITAVWSRDQSGLHILVSGTTTARSAAERFGEVINVRDEGAVLDGVTNDQTEFQAALDNLVGSGFVFASQGTLVGVSGNLIKGTEEPIWVLGGVTEAGVAPLLPGVIINPFNKRLVIQKNQTEQDDLYSVEFKRTVTHVGGTSGFGNSNIRVETINKSGNQNFELNAIFKLINNSIQADGADCTSSNFRSDRVGGGNTFTITMQLYDFLPGAGGTSVPLEIIHNADGPASGSWQGTTLDIQANTDPINVSTGNPTIAGSSTVLSDSGAAFQTDGRAAGDLVVNVSDGSTAIVTTVDTEGQITHSALSGGTSNDWQLADTYKVYTQARIQRSIKIRTAAEAGVTKAFIDHGIEFEGEINSLIDIVSGLVGINIIKDNGGNFTHGIDLISGNYSGSALRIPSNTPITLNTSGNKHIQYNSVDDEFHLLDGATERASISFTDGSYRVAGTKVLGARITGWGAPTGTATRTAFNTTTVTTQQLAERVKALIDDWITHGAIGA